METKQTETKDKGSDTKLDMEIFKTITTNCFAESKEEAMIENCDHLNRLVHALKYYTLLNVSHSQLSRDIFTEFMNVYKNALNDYTHFICQHSHDLEAIHTQLMNDTHFGECLLDKCVLFDRHFSEDRNRIITRSNTQDSSAMLHFYSDLFDNTHHFLFHLFHIGLRTKQSEMKMESTDENESKSDEKDEYECIDREFAQRRKVIENKRSTHGLRINRYSDESNTKFNINVSESH